MSFFIYDFCLHQNMISNQKLDETNLLRVYIHNLNSWIYTMLYSIFPCASIDAYCHNHSFFDFSRHSIILISFFVFVYLFNWRGIQSSVLILSNNRLNVIIYRQWIRIVSIFNAYRSIKQSKHALIPFTFIILLFCATKVINNQANWLAISMRP